MNRILCFAIICLFCNHIIRAQQLPGACTFPVVLSSSCSESCFICAINDFTAANESTELGTAPQGFCAPQLHNTQWVGFVAWSSEIMMQISVSSCQINGDGLQIGIYSTQECLSFELVSECYPSVPENTSAMFTASNLIVGGTYFIVIDGSNGDICDFSVDVLSGSGFAPFVQGNLTIEHVGPLCADGLIELSANGISGASIYRWTLNGTDLQGTGQSQSIAVPDTGSTFEVCVTPSNPCHTGSQVCMIFPINYDTIVTPELVVLTPDPYCINAPPIPLNPLQDNIIGVWSGPGIIGNTFYPDIAGSGLHEWLFTPNTGQCAYANTLLVSVEGIDSINALLPVLVSCDIGNGQGRFNLVDLENAISGGVGEVLFFQDPDGVYPIANPYDYTSGGGYVYANVASAGVCLSEPVSIELQVLQGVYQANISCVSTVCEGEIAVYTTPPISDCMGYNWGVDTHGVVLGGGQISDTFLIVHWIAEGVGHISLSLQNCSGNDFCGEPTIEEVPIIGEEVEIEGNAQVCPNEYAYYYLPAFEGVDIQWSVSPLGEIISGQGSSRLLVHWQNNSLIQNNQWVSAAFSSCFLGCGGADTIEVEMLPKLVLKGPAELCELSAGTFSVVTTPGNSPVVCDWTLKNPLENAVLDSQSNVSTFVLEATMSEGYYQLVAKPVQSGISCQDSVVRTIYIAGIPEPIETIEGDTIICAGQTLFYSALSATNATDIRWEIQNGTENRIYYGKDLDISWGHELPLRLSVSQTYLNGPRCFSVPTVFEPLILPSVELSGDTMVCKNTAGNYFASDTTVGNYHWEIIPASAGVILNNDSSAIGVVWKTAGQAIVRLLVCEQQVELPVQINAIPGSEIVLPDTLCSNEIVQIEITDPSINVEWFDEFGIPVQTQQIDTGFFRMLAVNQYGCELDTFIRIVRFPEENLTIFFNHSCLDSFSVDTLYTLETYNSYHYQWHLNGQPIGADSSILEINSPGYYYLEYLDQSGCSHHTDSLYLTYCSGHPTDSCFCPVMDILLDTISGCDYFQFSASFSQTPINYQWIVQRNGVAPIYFDDISFAYNFPYAGPWTIRIIANYPDPNHPGQFCQCIRTKNIVVPIKADFSIPESCSNQYAAFTDLSQYIHENNITDWLWNFNDPQSLSDSISNLPNPVHLFSASDTFFVSLTVIDTNGCASTIGKDVVTFPSPTAEFEVSSPVCYDAPALLSVVNSEPGAYAAWSIYSQLSGLQNNEEGPRIYWEPNNIGEHAITLIVSNVYHCFDTLLNIVKVPAPVTGSIMVQPGSIACENIPITLTAPNGGSSWKWTNGETTSLITLQTPGLYGVEVVDSFGCRYEFDEQTILFPEGPNYPIRAIEFDEYGFPVSYVYDSLQLCETEDVYLETFSEPGYEIVWFDGQTTNNIEFSELRNNQLVSGDYQIFIEISNNTNACVDTVFFSIDVHENPTEPEISADMAAPLCAGSEYALAIANPDSSYVYVWNTQDTSLAITTSINGDYYVSVFNQYGCENRSDSLSILPEPNLVGVPSGCYNRCSPDTLCLPEHFPYLTYQWVLNGEFLSSDSLVIIDQSGAYQLLATDEFGCSNTSDPLYLSLEDGLSFIQGAVYFDTNENGVIDANDETMPNVSVVAHEGDEQYTSHTLNDGTYFIPFVLNSTYSIFVDSASLQIPAIISPLNIDTTLIGCNSFYTFDWLIKPTCPVVEGTVFLAICAGDTAYVSNYSITRDTSILLIDGATNGCDSLLYIDIEYIESDTQTLVLTSCHGEVLYFGDLELLPGTDTLFLTTSNVTGCDSFIHVLVEEVIQPAITVEVKHSCSNSNSGEIIAVSDQAGTLFSLNNIDYQSTGNFDGLGHGYSVLYYMTSITGNCIYQDTIFIDSIPELQIIGSDYSLECILTDSVEIIPTIQNGMTDEMTFLWLDNLSSDANRIVTLPGVYTLESSNGCETVSTVFEVILNNNLSDAAIITDTIIACSDSALILANLPAGSSGLWSSTEEIQFEHPTEPQTNINQIPATGAYLIWTLSTEQCPAYSSDTLVIASLPLLIANDDYLQIESGVESGLILLFENDLGPDANEIDLSLAGDVSNGTYLLSVDTFTFFPQLPFGVEQEIPYSICLKNCPDYCSDAVLHISFQKKDYEIPNAITPNGDGLNEVLFFDLINDNPDAYPDNEIIIFNRWADIVYYAKPYLNNWGGNNQKGKPLPHGTYYYILRLNISRGEIIMGDVTILK